MLSLIGETIRNARLKKGLSMGQLARASGMTTSYLSYIESEQRIPSKKVLIKISKVLDASLDKLVNSTLETIRKRYYE